MNAGCMRKVSQMPVVLIPVHFDRDTAPIQQNREPSVQRSIVVRPFITNDFMTGEAAIPGQHLPLEVPLLPFTLLFLYFTPTRCSASVDTVHCTVFATLRVQSTIENTSTHCTAYAARRLWSVWQQRSKHR